MAALTDALVRRWPILAGLASAAMLATAHAFQRLGGYQPCPLCLRQREVYWGALLVVIAGLALVRAAGFSRRTLCLLLGAVFTTSLIVAGFHAGVEWKWWPGPTTCAGLGGGGGISVQDMSELLAGARFRPPACDEAAWRMAGLSMAGWNALVSLGLALASFLAAFGAKHEEAPR